MRKRNLLVKPLINDCMLGVWSDDSIQSINVIEGKLEELESLHHAYNELEATNKELYKENKEVKDKENHYKNKFYTTHKQAEQIKENIRKFLNDLSFKGLLKIEDEDKPLQDVLKEVCNKITQTLERLEEINKVWHNNEPMESVDINGKHLQELYEYNEKLIKENQELKQYPLEIDGMFYSFEGLVERNNKLQNENQELRDKLNSQDLDIWQLHCKYGEFKKAIEILKDRFDFKFNDESKVIYLLIKGLSLHIYSWCFKSQEEYELLKEVLDE